jgi:hypothetical protein
VHIRLAMHEPTGQTVPPRNAPTAKTAAIQGIRMPMA